MWNGGREGSREDFPKLGEQLSGDQLRIDVAVGDLLGLFHHRYRPSVRRGARGIVLSEPQARLPALPAQHEASVGRREDLGCGRAADVGVPLVTWHSQPAKPGQTVLVYGDALAAARLVVVTSPRTARALAEGLGAASDKTVVLTGAMIPYAFGSSDGLFNLGDPAASERELKALIAAARVA